MEMLTFNPQELTQKLKTFYKEKSNVYLHPYIKTSYF